MRRLVVSFPKSGRTWLRYGLHLAGHPDISFSHDGFEYNDGSLPPLNFDPQRRIDAYLDVDSIVYIERDPRDTIVSLYHQVTGRFDDFFGYTGSISDFIRDPYFGVENLVNYQNLWRSVAPELGVLTVKYEDMSTHYEAVLAQVMRHFDLEAQGKTLAEIARQASFDEMKEVEQNETFAQPWLRPRLNAPKVRKGRVGGYLDDLSDADIRFVEDTIARLSVHGS